MKRNKNNSLFDPVLLRRSLRASFTKLDPRQMIKNPIMFTVEAVTFAMLLLIVRIAVTGDTSQGSLLYNLVIFAGASLNGALRQFRRGHRRSPRQGAGRLAAQNPRGDPRQTHRTRRTVAHRQQFRTEAGRPIRVRRGRHRRRRRRDRRGPGVDRRKRHHGRIGPGDPRGGRRQKLRHGRHEGPLRPHSRESHRTARREFPRPDDRPGRRLLAPEDAQRNRADDPAGRVHARFRHRLRHAQALRRLCGGQYHRRGVHLAVRLPDPDHHRRPAVGHRHRRHGPRPAGQRHHQVGQGRRDRRRHRHAAPGQDRHHHHRQPQGHALPSRRRHRPQGFRAHVRALVRRRPDPRRQIRRRAGRRRRGPHRPGGDGRRADGEIHRRNQVFGRRHARRTPHPQGSRRSNLPHRRRARKPLPGRNRSHRAHHLRKRRHTARSLRKRTDHGRHRVAGHHQDGHPRTLRAAAPDGREDRDGHGRQSADGQIHRREGRRRRLHRRKHVPRTSSNTSAANSSRASWWP